MFTVKMLAKGRIVIPAKMRKRCRLTPGSKLQLMAYGGVIRLVPPVEDPIKAAQSSLPSRPSLAAQLLRERRNGGR